MPANIDTFYNIFWQNKTCRNLFLLSKEELLETRTFGEGKNAYNFSSNRIIISNISENQDETETIKFRNENSTIILDKDLENKIEYFKPLLEDFINQNFKKALEKLSEDIENRGWAVLIKVIRILSNEKTREKKLVKLLQDYGFVGKHLSSFKEIEADLENKFLPKKGSSLVNENTIKTFFEAVKFTKELYVNNSYSRLYSTNQILVNTLNQEDDFESRLKLFRLLFDQNIIHSSKDDAFIECPHCEQGSYKGVFQLKLNPIKLKELKCPICSNEVTYFVPYRLDQNIFDIVKEKDGLLLDAYTNKLSEFGFTFQTNIIFQEDIEVDCIFEGLINNVPVHHIVEIKMFKLNNTPTRLESKIKKSYGKLIQDVKRLQELKEFAGKTLKPVLLVNVTDIDLINTVSKELKFQNSGILHQNSEILNIEMLRFSNG